jgi:maleylpyruvate isomerase
MNNDNNGGTATSRLKLYGFWRSTATWRVRIALEYKGIAYDYEPIDLSKGVEKQHSDEYRSKNPMRQVPLLEIDGAAGGLRIAQSIAIIEYLDERFPEPRLLPEDPVLRARARQLAEMTNSGIQPLQNTSVQGFVRDELKADEKAWTRHWVSRGLAALEVVTAETAGRFSIGDSISLPDILLVPELNFARRFSIPLDPYPTLTRIEAACADLPAFARAHADRQPDAR